MHGKPIPIKTVMLRVRIVLAFSSPDWCQCILLIVNTMPDPEGEYVSRIPFIKWEVYSK